MNFHIPLQEVENQEPIWQGYIKLNGSFKRLAPAVNINLA